MTHIKALFRYPVKSLGRQKLESVETTAQGFKYDRHWMLVNAEHQMLTQRELPELTKLSAMVINDVLNLINIETNDSFTLPAEEITTEKVETSIWGTDIAASKVSKQANEWLSDQMNEEIFLIGAGQYFQRSRLVNEETVPLLFADGYPILVLSQASVDYLNQKLTDKIDESRFRANIIIDGCPAHSEDLSGFMKMKNAILEISSPCKRCIMINTNQATGEVSKEPLKTLSTYRVKHNKVQFGMNARTIQNGQIMTKEVVEVDIKT